MSFAATPCKTANSHFPAKQRDGHLTKESGSNFLRVADPPPRATIHIFSIRLHASIRLHTASTPALRSRHDLGNTMSPSHIHNESSRIPISRAHKFLAVCERSGDRSVHKLGADFVTYIRPKVLDANQ
jgi:hypothetical protein